jgi:thiamine kinase-like enzyme
VASVEHLTAEAVIPRISDWSGLHVAWEPLGGGITNHNYLVTVTGRPDIPWGGKYVLRIPGDGTDTFVDRERELTNHAAAAATGVTPPLLCTLEPEKCTVVPFITGELMHPETLAGHRDRLGKVVDVVATYHAAAQFCNEIQVFDMIRRYLEMAHDVEAPLPEEMGEMLALCDRIEEAMLRDAPAPVACHNDLLSENFILDRDGKMWLIDWEYGGMTDPYFDLGDFCVEHPLSDEEERFIIARYCGEMQEHRYARMMLHKLVADLWWSIWAMIQVRLSKIDFDFLAYGLGRIARFHVNAGKPDLATWLATV